MRGQGQNNSANAAGILTRGTGLSHRGTRNRYKHKHILEIIDSFEKTSTPEQNWDAAAKAYETHDHETITLAKKQISDGKRIFLEAYKDFPGVDGRREQYVEDLFESFQEEDLTELLKDLNTDEISLKNSLKSLLKEEFPAPNIYAAVSLHDKFRGKEDEPKHIVSKVEQGLHKEEDFRRIAGKQVLSKPDNNFRERIIEDLIAKEKTKENPSQRFIRGAEKMNYKSALIIDRVIKHYKETGEKISLKEAIKAEIHSM